MTIQPAEFTELLKRADAGDTKAAERLFRLVENQLRSIAKKRKQNLPQGVDMSTTALVNDAFLGVVGQQCTEWPTDSRKQFFAYIATAMHGLLIDTARAHSAKKRGGDMQRVDGQDGRFEIPDASDIEDVDLLIDLKSALYRFDQFADIDALIFRVRYFLGLTFDEIADIFEMSATSIKRSFERAKSWLATELKEYADDT